MMQQNKASHVTSILMTSNYGLKKLFEILIL